MRLMGLVYYKEGNPISPNVGEVSGGSFSKGLESTLMGPPSSVGIKAVSLTSSPIFDV